MINAEKAKKVTDVQATSLILQCLFGSVGRGGVSEPQLTRFVIQQSARGFSNYRCEKMLHEMVRSGTVNVEVSTSTNGRISRKYHVTIEGILSLTALAMSLPKHSRHETQRVLEPVYQAAMKVFATEVSRL